MMEQSKKRTAVEGGSSTAAEDMAGLAGNVDHNAASGQHREPSFACAADWALHYAQAMGWYVFPGKKDGKKGKVPLVKWGRGLETFDPSQDLRAFAATRDPALIAAWWERWPDAEIGIDTGRSGLIVLDVDVRDDKDGERELANLLAICGDLPPTLEQRTPSGGRQLVFTSDTLCRSLATKEGLDVRSRGGMIFVPSAKPDRTWTWRAPSPAPDWLPKEYATVTREKSAGSDDAGLWTVEDLEEALAQLNVEVFSGNHGLWFTAMCAAHHATNGEGEDVFFDWCAGDGQYANDEAANRYRWHTLNAGKEGGATYKFLMKLLRDPTYTDLWTEGHDPNWMPQWERPNFEPENDFDEVPMEEPEEPRKQGRFRLLSRAQLANLPPPRWLVRDMLPENALVGLYGEPGAGKSFVAVDLSLSIAHGRGWHGRTVVPGAVLYVAGEGVAGMNARVRAWELTHQPGPTENWSVVPDAVNLADPKTAEAFARFVKEELGPLRLIVVDTLARCTAGADENSAKDMGNFVAGCDALRKATGATVLIVHHSGKDSAKGMRGSTALLGAVDTTVRVEKEGRGLTVAVVKQKDAEPLMPLTFGMEAVHVGGGPDEIRSSIVLTSRVVPAEEEDWDDTPERQALKLAVAHDGYGKKAFAEVVVAAELVKSVSEAMRLLTDAMPLTQATAATVEVDGSSHRVWMECIREGKRKTYKVRVVQA